MVGVEGVYIVHSMIHPGVLKKESQEARAFCVFIVSKRKRGVLRVGFVNPIKLS